MSRIFFILAVFVTLFAGALAYAGVRSDVTTGTIQVHSGNPYLLDFMVLSNKRADLKISVTQKGVDAAFSDWLRAERPLAYQNALKESASRNKATVAKGDASCCNAACSHGSCCKETSCTAKSFCCSGKGSCDSKSGSCCTGSAACCTQEKRCGEGSCCKDNCCSDMKSQSAQRLSTSPPTIPPVSVAKASCCA